MGGLSDEETNSEYYSYLAKRHKKRIEPKKAKIKQNYLRPLKLELSLTTQSNIRLLLRGLLCHHKSGKQDYRQAVVRTSESVSGD